MKKENDILEETLQIAERGYAAAYRFLSDEYEMAPENSGPQTLYFLACLAGGAGFTEKALGWLRSAIRDKGWWYRPEVLDDDDLEPLKNDSEFISLKSLSDARYADAVAKGKSLFSWKQKTADNLFLAVHGNTQNGETARNDWTPIFAGENQWQIETIQSAEPDGYGTYRWSYDQAYYLPVAEAIEKARKEGYRKVICGGFSAGCDMLLRSIMYSTANCDMLVLQSPWIPILRKCEENLISAVKEKNTALRIFCGSEDEDCLPMAERLYTLTNREKIDVKLTVQESIRHQFPSEMYTLKELL